MDRAVLKPTEGGEGRHSRTEEEVIRRGRQSRQAGMSSTAEEAVVERGRQPCSRTEESCGNCLLPRVTLVN